ncbi:MAG: hypothetical protein ABSH13_17070 [Candidatus Acidiferrum sp.]|jgi:hypothetical protein
MKTISLWLAGILAVLLIAGFAMLSRMAGSPKDAFYMLRYALPHMHRGKLHPGDSAPDARLLALNGKEYFHLRERSVSGRPLMVVFGSYT